MFVHYILELNMAGEISRDDVTKIIEIANKSASGELKLPEPDRQNLMKALAKLKGTFETPVEATIELASGVRMIPFPPPPFFT